MYWSEDESRVGMLTEQGRRITAKGVKPKGKVQWDFKYRWVYGAVVPQSGESFFWEFSHLNSDCFEAFLEKLSKCYPNHLHVMQIDGARAHTAKKLKIPRNIRLLKQPPYCPEVNVIERVWEEFKKKVKWKTYQDIQEVQSSISEWIQGLSVETVKSLTQWAWLMEGLSASAIY